MVGWPGAPEDRLPADALVIRAGRAGVPRRRIEGSQAFGARHKNRCCASPPRSTLSSPMPESGPCSAASRRPGRMRSSNAGSGDAAATSWTAPSASMPSSASNGASSRSNSLAMPGLIWTPGGPGAGSGLRRRMSATPAIFSVAQPLMHTSHDSGDMCRREATVSRADIRDGTVALADRCV